MIRPGGRTPPPHRTTPRRAPPASGSCCSTAATGTTSRRPRPWLLAGAKTLSYAVNRAAFREAARRDADDALFVSSDGYLLEGAISNLVMRTGKRIVTPRTDLGILTGTTQADLFRWAEGAGYETGYELLTPDDLLAADAAWLVSSVRHAAAVREIDGQAFPVDRELSDAMNEFLRGAHGVARRKWRWPRTAAVTAEHEWPRV